MLALETQALKMASEGKLIRNFHVVAAATLEWERPDGKHGTTRILELKLVWGHMDFD